MMGLQGHRATEPQRFMRHSAVRRRRFATHAAKVGGVSRPAAQADRRTGSRVAAIGVAKAMDVKAFLGVSVPLWPRLRRHVSDAVFHVA